MQHAPSLRFARGSRAFLALVTSMLALLAACAGPKHAPASESAHATGRTGAAAAEHLGPLSEAEFKALHELNPVEPPPRRGREIELAGGRAYLSLPAGAQAPLPGVVVIHEWWGLNDHIRHWADRLAAEGYAALAVDLYGGVVATNPDEALAAMQAVDSARALEVLLAAERYLRDEPAIRAPSTGSIGWCFGGSMSLQLALNAPELDAAVIYYGGKLVTDAQQLAVIRARVLGIFGSRDASIPLDKVKAFQAGLTEAGVRHAIWSFDGEHAFANPSRPAYRAPLAAEAWETTRAFLAEALSR